MTIVDVGPHPSHLFSPGPPSRDLLHQRLSGPAWRRVIALATVAVVAVFTVLAVVIALRAPAISPVTAPLPVAGVPVAPAPTSGLLDLFGSFGVGPDGPGRGGGGRGR